MSTKIVQVKPLTLSSNIGTSNTTAIVSGMIGLDGVDLVQADFGTIIYGTFEPNTTREEAVSFTITANTAGVADIDFGVSGRGLIGKSPYGTGGITYAHSAGAKLVISNNPNLFNKFTAKDNNEVVTGSWEFPTTPVAGNNPATKTWTEAAIAAVSAVLALLDAAVVKLTGNQTVAGIKTFSSSPIVPAPTTDLQAATKKYADDLAIAGAPNASETVKGLVEEATLAQFDAGTDIGETGAELFVPPSILNKRLGVNCRVYNNVGGSLLSEIVVPFELEQFDTNGFHDNTTNNSRLTIPAGYGGLYMIGGCVRTSNTNNSELRIRLNGSTLIAGNSAQGSSTEAEINVTTIYSLSDGDYIELLAASSTNTYLAGVVTNFWLVRLF